jgi:hypothetical protein
VYIQGHESEYHSFLAQNRAFWRENNRRTHDADGRLYVDLSHDNPAYLATNLWVSKYVQKVRGGKLVGLAHGWLRACPHYNFERVRELADSFLVDEVVDVDSLAGDDPEELPRFEAAVRDLSGAELRQAILRFDADRCPDIGWILYDTWLRQERCGTLEALEPGLIECARTVFRVRRSISTVMRRGITVGAVVGHYHYSPYSFIALEAARQGAPVYFQSLLIPVSVRRFNTAEDMRHGRAADFLEMYERHIVARSGAERLASFERRLFDIQKGTREFFRATSGTGVSAGRDEVLKAIGLEPGFPVACFYVPALCGAPHCFGPILFDDLADWLRKSLDIASKLPQVNFLVKRHPQDAVYDTGNIVGQLERIYGAATNIHFLRENLSSHQLADISDAVVTVSGTPGYDMAVRGVPTIAAGPSRYSALGFAREPGDMEAYETLLRTAGTYRLTPEQRRRALVFAYFELALGRSSSLFLPQVRSAGTAAFWEDAERKLRAHFVEEDPLYRNVRHMLMEDLPFLLNTDLAQS